MEGTSEISDASSEKEKGNQHFMMGEYNDAIAHYSESIAKLPAAATYANRALCFIKLNRYQEAEADCSEALKIDVHYSKAYYRRSIARKGLGRIEDSLEDAFAALRLEPNDRLVQKLFAELSLVVKDSKTQDKDRAETILDVDRPIFVKCECLEAKVQSKLSESKILVREMKKTRFELLMNLIVCFGILSGIDPFGGTIWGPIYMKVMFILGGAWFMRSAWSTLSSLRGEMLEKVSFAEQLKVDINYLLSQAKVERNKYVERRCVVMLVRLGLKDGDISYPYYAIVAMFLLGVVPITYHVTKGFITGLADGKGHALLVATEMMRRRWDDE